MRGSGQIEQDADVVMLLDYPSEKDVESDEKPRSGSRPLRVIEIAKTRAAAEGLPVLVSAARSSGSSPSGKAFISPNYA